jgi:hypothetical protein
MSLKACSVCGEIADMAALVELEAPPGTRRPPLGCADRNACYARAITEANLDCEYVERLSDAARARGDDDEAERLMDGAGLDAAADLSMLLQSQAAELGSDDGLAGGGVAVEFDYSGAS